MSTILTETQKKSFKESGYLKIKTFFNKEEIEQIKNWVTELQSLKETPGKWMMYFEQSKNKPSNRILNRIENFEPYHKGFKKLFNFQMLNCVAQLFDSPTVLFKDKINFKMPGGSGFNAHQDVQAGWDKYCKIHITVLVSIDKSNKKNGCLELSPGNHLRGILGEKWTPLDENSLNYISCPSDPGDVVFFDSYCPHRSKPNDTDQPRRVLYVTYNKLNEGDHRKQYYADKRKNYPQDCERDPKKQYKYFV